MPKDEVSKQLEELEKYLKEQRERYPQEDRTDEETGIIAAGPETAEDYDDDREFSYDEDEIVDARPVDGIPDNGRDETAAVKKQGCGCGCFTFLVYIFIFMMIASIFLSLF